MDSLGYVRVQGFFGFIGGVGREDGSSALKPYGLASTL